MRVIVPMWITMLIWVMMKDDDDDDGYNDGDDDDDDGGEDGTGVGIGVNNVGGCSGGVLVSLLLMPYLKV